MKKKIIVALIMIAMLIVFGGCSKIDVYEQEKEIKRTTFMEIENVDAGKILVDRDTGVMYWESWGGHAYGILTPIINADGTPKVWQNMKR